MKKLTLLSLLSVALLFGCSKDDDNSTSAAATSNASSSGTIDPSNADAISDALILPSQALRMSGNIPAESSGDIPLVSTDNPILTTSNGSTAPVGLNYSNAKRKLGGVHLQVVGASTHYNIPMNVQSVGDSGNFELPVGIPANVKDGQIRLKLSVYDTDKADLHSKPIEIVLDILKLGTGSVQVSLSWDTDTDQDLYVIDPANDTIYYERTSVDSGGQLDRDDTDGQGPENIFWEGASPDGSYSVLVHDYDNTSTPNKCYITVSGGGTSKQFEVTTQNGSKVLVTSFTKTGTSIRF